LSTLNLSKKKIQELFWETYQHYKLTT